MVVKADSIFSQHCFSSLKLPDTAFLRPYHSILIKLQSGPSLDCTYSTLTLFFFSHSIVGLLLCLGSLSCFMTQFGPSLSCQTDGLTFYLMTSRHKTSRSTHKHVLLQGLCHVTTVSCYAEQSAAFVPSREHLHVSQQGVMYICMTNRNAD